MPAMWSALIQSINNVARLSAGNTTNTTQQVLDAFQNATYIQGQLAATVTEGGGWSASGSSIGAKAIAGTQSATGLSGFGTAKCLYYPGANNVSTGNTTMSYTPVLTGSQTIVVVSATGFTNGMGVAGYGVPPGTTITNISGTTITISNYCTGTLAVTGVPCVVFAWSQT